ncbi:elongation factor 4 [Candidatus Peregrinibacteria bacterium CG10_big_fil_rev_8_21_14_0_10_49_16]|nr:MAG: elongation factor 4 [Candidatus Peregrinibacteria bacterium CG22_combo_CG10-13_8_21_14_all_49_11]PIR51727.1 MAG: elongation factor 4 [Candidatus Peregrinibacteria bacterium CG10_big_fil_rev_8_21_14_0_10_49_16]
MDIRNFCIIAHIDHGKSTLADRFLQVTKTVQERDMKEQTLDMMDLERERGITIKLQPVRMMHKGMQLNLIDTPGHTDFRYEVSRSLAACEGAILLVDASQGVQAQTIAVLMMALEHDLTIIPVLNKIDLPAADPERTGQEVCGLLGCSMEDILRVSAKEGTGVEAVLDAVRERIPAPVPAASGDGARALVFDAVSDTYRGVIAYVRVIDGVLHAGQSAYLLGAKHVFSIQEVGYFTPQYHACDTIGAGEIGYIVTGLKDVRYVRTGETVASEASLEPLPGYTLVQPMVFAGLYPIEADGYAKLREALEKLALNDAAFRYEPERNSALGNGFRCGFLGLLHLDIVQERLERQFDCDLIVTAPTVSYEVRFQAKRPAEVIRASLLKVDDPQVAVISNPADFPDPTYIDSVSEPWVRLEVVCRSGDIGPVMTLVQERRGTYISLQYLEAERALLVFEVPLQGIVLDFFDALKSATEGFGSMHYDPLGFRQGDLVKLHILLLGESADALSTIVHRSEAHDIGARLCKKLKEVIPKAQFPIPIQAAIGAKVVARETVSALRKDVTGHLYGGDVTRKRKLLEKQKKGKKRLKQMGKVLLNQDAFMAVLKR